MLGQVILRAGLRSPRPASRGFTLIELFVGVAILAIVLALGIPSMRDWMIAQRVSSVASELATDMRYARSDAISGNNGAGVVVNNTGKGCYTVFRAPPSRLVQCNCTLAAGSVCPFPLSELKTVVMPANGDVSINAPTLLTEVYTTGAKLIDEGAAMSINISGGGTRQLRVITSAGLHHPTVCKPSGSTITGFQPCP